MSQISVIIPARNAAITIQRTLQSLTGDRAHIGEIILVDDQSVDATCSRAQAAAREFELPLMIQKIAAGSAGDARNAGIAAAKMPFLYFIDADDVLLPGGLGRLLTAIGEDTDTGLAIGASVRTASGANDLTRTPSGFGRDRLENAVHYLLNGAPPISMGSGLVRASVLQDIRFPGSILIDEDTWFWTALLATTPVAVTTEPVLRYHLDAQRTAQRYLVSPRRAWIGIVLAFRRLQMFGIPAAPLKWRRAWIAQRFARQLIKHGRYAEARSMLRVVAAHPDLNKQWRTNRYRILAGAGHRLGRNRKRPSMRPRGEHRTLVLCHDPAWPPVSGADLRNVQNVQAAASYGPSHLVSLRPHDVDGPVPKAFTVASLTRSGEPRSPSINRPRAKIEPRISSMVLDRLLAEVGRFQPDTVIVEGIGLQAFIEPLRTHVPRLVLDMHNVESDLARQTKAGLMRDIAARLNARLLSWREKQAGKRVDRIWTCTSIDRDRVCSGLNTRVPVDVVPNAIPRFDEIPANPGARSMSGPSPTILFVGHLGYAPNVQAAVRLARDIFPRIRSAFPQARLQLAGRHPKPPVKALADLPGVQLHANPANLDGFFDEANLSIVPLSAGGGSRIKILEAAAWGIPIVATPLAVEGLELEPGRHVLVGETDEELSRLAVDLLNDEPRLLRQREETRQTVKDLYGPEAIRLAVGSGLRL